MSESTRTMSPGRKWILRIFAGLLIASSAWPAYILAPQLKTLAKSFSGPNALPKDKLAELLAPAAIHLIWVVLAIVLGVWLLRRTFKRKAAVESEASSAGEAPTVAAPKSAPRQAKKEWAYCNVLQSSADTRQVWQFDARNEFKLNREQTARGDELLPPHLGGKSWNSLWQPKLNVAWLPAQHVFLRVAQFPQASPEETRTMVELQLEKLSPIPVTQAVWTLHILSQATGNMQTVVVTIVERSVVEEYLGQLEGQGFLADRLDVPMLDQLQTVVAKEDGAWIYPEAQGGNHTVLVAWWYGGVLQTVDYLTLASGQDRAASLKDQLVQMAWAGELDGWLTKPPTWHLVAEASVAAEWEPPLRQELERPVDVLAPLPTAELAALTARRAAQADPQDNLLPAEFGVRYRQQFRDRLWGRALLALLAVYGVCVIVYFIAVQFVRFQTSQVETALAVASPAYTNDLAVISRYAVLKDREDLTFAALDCWQSVAELLPEGVVLDTLSFNDGKKLQLGGTASADKANEVIDFCGKLRKVIRPNQSQPLFKTDGGETPSITGNQPGGMMRWGFALELKRSEVE